MWLRCSRREQPRFKRKPISGSNRVEQRRRRLHQALWPRSRHIGPGIDRFCRSGSWTNGRERLGHSEHRRRRPEHPECQAGSHGQQLLFAAQCAAGRSNSTSKRKPDGSGATCTDSGRILWPSRRNSAGRYGPNDVQYNNESRGQREHHQCDWNRRRQSRRQMPERCGEYRRQSVHDSGRFREQWLNRSGRREHNGDTVAVTPVTLVVNDSEGVNASCQSTVTVQDHQLPTISCPAPQTILCTSASGAAANLHPTVFDNCPAVTASCLPPSGSRFGFGTTSVTCTAMDASGNSSNCPTSVTVVDVPPVIASVVASPNVLRPPNKKLDPVTILVKDTDVCDPNPVCSISAVATNSGPAIAGTDYVITGPLNLKLKAAGNGGHALTYIVSVTCADHHGGSTTAQTTVQAPL